jgi:aldehyde:ferredoxin oxidoreductase
MCAFLLDLVVASMATRNTADLMEAVTGLVYTPDEIQMVGERINNLARAFNVKAGFTRADDTLPKRLMTDPLKEGAAKGHVISQDDLNTMLDEYYIARGWDVKTGLPTKEKLVELGLAYAADEIS